MTSNAINNSKKIITKYIFHITLISVGFSIFVSFGLPYTTNIFSYQYAEQNYSKEYLNKFKSDILKKTDDKKAFIKEGEKSYMNFLYSISNT